MFTPIAIASVTVTLIVALILPSAIDALKQSAAARNGSVYARRPH